LLSLDNAGVREIKLAYTNAGTNPDQHGNEHRQTSTYTTTSGTARAVHDVWFSTDNWNTIDQPLYTTGMENETSNPAIITKQRLGLAQMHFSVTVREMQQVANSRSN